ncbi:hypothetical protein Hanom_Chr14g01259161 [Helianthus anomalus]
MREIYAIVGGTRLGPWRSSISNLGAKLVRQKRATIMVFQIDIYYYLSCYNYIM